MGTKQSKQALIDRRHRPLARSCETEQVINLAHGLSFGRLRSHISSGYARFNGGQLESNLYDPVVLGGRGFAPVVRDVVWGEGGPRRIVAGHAGPSSSGRSTLHDDA